MAWTEEQMQCIQPKAGIHNILVSAGAGAGKTATLVEKITRGVISGNVGINEILSVTFTRDAAREMKERIISAIEELLRKRPNDSWLKRQLALTETASIMTIDSFCLRIIKDHISETDIDPAFRIADQAELELLADKGMKDYLETCYEEGKPEFISFADAYATGRHDDGIKDAILSVYRMAVSNPFPNEWIAENRAKLSESVEKQDWMGFLLNDIRLQVLAIQSNLTAALAICNESDGPYPYIQTVEGDLEQVKDLLEKKDYSSLSERLGNLTFGRMSPKKDAGIHPGKKEMVSGIRNASKKTMQDLQKKFVFKGVDLQSDLDAMRPHMLMLLELTEGFMSAYAEAKKTANVVDFTDIEHVALELLLDKDTKKETELADSVAQSFKEVYVDEYQDVNFLQETILKCVSGERFGKPNLFMVGDVKQSIYKFRLARPELFLEKYESYEENELAKSQKVELRKNFRSRKEVINTINFFFEQLMTTSLGNLDYDEKTALNPGAVYPNGVDVKKTGLYLIDTNTEESEFPDLSMDEKAIKGRQMEAMLIADLIKNTVDREAVYDKETGKYRVATYRDIVVLTRTFTGWAEDIQQILDTEGIPAYADKTEGFFDTVEVQAVLSMLQVADNPMQDIPLAASMMQVWGFTEEEMTDLVAFCKSRIEITGNRLYQNIMFYIQEGLDPILIQKLENFMAYVKKINTECHDYSIFDLLNMIYLDTGYYSKVTSLPTGEIKKANLEMLLVEAEKFSERDTSAGSVFQFIRYVDMLRKYERESSAASVNDQNAVRITTIHKSKGLEFPIVILAGIGKKFNQQDTRKTILVHQDLGIVSDIMDPETRTKKLTLAKKTIARKIQIETLEEELRILYVAMTRAKERLIMIGSDKDIVKRLQKCAAITSRKERSLPYMELTQATSYMDWIFLALARNEAFASYLENNGIVPDSTNPFFNKNANIEVFSVNVATLLKGQHEDLESEILDKQTVEETVKNATSTIKSNASYAYIETAKLAPKALPEDLLSNESKKPKKKGTEPEEKKRELVLPKFLRKDELTGAEKGTGYHRIMQTLDFKKCGSEDGIKNELTRLIAENILNPEEAKALDMNLIYRFFASDLGKSMIAADSIKKEVYYMEAIPAKLVNEKVENETVIMQGVIDAYFETPEGYVLVDYKSEHVAKGKERFAVKKHIPQINRYRNVLEKNSGKPVKTAYVVFLQTGKAIEVK